MKIDAWTHFLSPAYREYLESRPLHGPGAFLLAQTALHDVDARLRVISAYDDYRQVLAPMPGPHVVADALAASPEFIQLVQRNNDEMAAIVQQHPDRFAGFVAATAIGNPEAATEETIRSVRELGALGVQLEADAANVPLHEARYNALFTAVSDLGACVWLHPYRTPASPGAAPEAAAFLLWQVFGWTFDTTLAVSRLIFGGVYDRHPGLKLIAHHGGGMVPHFSGRLEMMAATPMLDVTGALAQQLERFDKPLLEYFRMMYVDTAMFGGGSHGVRCTLDFFGPEHVLFGTDAPFDGQDGAHFISRTIEDVEGATADSSVLAAVFHSNATRTLGL